MSGYQQHVFILGAAKCGTSSLYSALTTSNDVCGSQPKEPCFFEANSEYSKGFDYYRDTYFPHRNGTRLLLEARGANLLLPYVPARIHAAAPNAKLIVICRNPVRRAFSHWWMRYSRKREDLPFEQALWRNLEAPDLKGDSHDEMARRWEKAMEPGSGWVSMRVYVEMGMYATQIERYLGHFSRESIHIMIAEEAQANPAREMSKLWDFLEVSEENRGKYSNDFPVSNESLTKAHAHINRMPGKRVLSSILPKIIRDRSREHLKDFGSRPRLENETVPPEIIEIYNEENSKLADLLARSTSPWNLTI